MDAEKTYAIQTKWKILYAIPTALSVAVYSVGFTSQNWILQTALMDAAFVAIYFFLTNIHINFYQNELIIVNMLLRHRIPYSHIDGLYLNKHFIRSPARPPFFTVEYTNSRGRTRYVILAAGFFNTTFLVNFAEDLYSKNPSLKKFHRQLFK